MAATIRAKGAKEMSHVPWSELVYYDENSPSGLLHARDICYGNGKTLVKARTGDIAGSIAKSGYYVYNSYKYGIFQVHRIIWILKYKVDIPVDCIIDHINGDKTDNHTDNLRIVSDAENNRNTKIYSNNTSGKVGVYFDTKIWQNGTRQVRYYWKASWMELDGTQKTKSFSIDKYGLLPAMKMACDYRLERIKELNVQGAGYTTRHGITGML
jgi:hypothetical protein